MKTQPNLIVILADQLRRQSLGCYGDPNAVTPNIDALAASGAQFDNACCSYPICVPSRFTLMTGECAHTRMVPSIGWRMSPAEHTLADAFNGAGYDTIYVGKWHLYGTHHQFETMSWNDILNRSKCRPVPPSHQGRWQKWLGFELNNDLNGTWYYEDDDPTPRPLGKYQTDGLFDLALEQISQEREAPFCCVVSVVPPHFPLVAPEDLEKKWAGREITMRGNWDTHPDLSPMSYPHNFDAEKAMAELRIYYAMIENLDQNIGRLMERLEDQGMRDSTMVVLLSDHGEMGGSHGINFGAKHWPFEESVGIPLIVSGPGIEPATHLAQPTCMEDLYPTLLGLCGDGEQRDMPGVDLSPLARGESESVDRPGIMMEYVCEQFGPFHARQWRAFRSERYLYSVIGDEREGGKPWQFFDLQEDPYQLQNLIASESYRDTITMHHGWLRDRLIETGDHYFLAEAHGHEALNPIHPVPQ